MKCPYCNSEFLQYGNTLMCSSFECEFHHVPIPIKIWQDLIDGKKAQGELERTRKALDKAKWWLHEIVESHRCTPISTAEMALKEIEQLIK